MKRAVALLALVCLAGAVAAMGVDSQEVPIHYTPSQPLALESHETVDSAAPAAEAEPRFMQSEDEAEAEDAAEEAEGEDDRNGWMPYEAPVDADPISSTVDGDESYPERELGEERYGEIPSEWQQSVNAQNKAADKADAIELAKPDQIMQESVNTMTRSAKCLMVCANSYGLCTRRNKQGCACAAGCMCNRGDAGATCAQHCHPDNQMYFVYGYHDADHFSPHLWPRSIGDVMENYDHVRACLRGCAARGQCRARFCPRHPTGGHKCTECRRLAVVPVRGSPSKRYFTIPYPKRVGVIHHRVHSTHTDSHSVDAFGQIHHHHHTHTHHDHDHFPRFAEQHAEVESGAEMEVHMETDAETVHNAEAEAKSEYIRMDRTPYTTTLGVQASNIPQIQPRTVSQPRVWPQNGADAASNGPVDAYVPQDRLARKVDCNFMDCTGMQSEPFVPAGSLNPVIPYVNNPETRTTTFSTVPDLLEPRTETKVVYVA